MCIRDRAYSFASSITKVSLISFFVYHSCNIAMSSFAYLLGSSSILSLSFGEDMFSNNPVDPCSTSPHKEGVGPLEGCGNNFKLDSRHPRRPPAVIPLRDFLRANPNFLEESSNSSLTLDFYTSGRPVSYLWEAFVANLLPGGSTSVGMPPTIVVEESE